MKKTAVALAWALALSSIVTLTSPAYAAAPTVATVTGPSGQATGSVTGGYDIDVRGEEFCSGSTPIVSGLQVGYVSISTSFTVT